MIDKGMNRKELSEKADISNTTIAKLGKGENDNTSVLVKICQALECDISERVEIVRD